MFISMHEREDVLLSVMMLYECYAGWICYEELQKRGCASVQNEASKHCGIQGVLWRSVKIHKIHFIRIEDFGLIHGSLSFFLADGHLYIVMEFCSGGDLLQRIQQQKNGMFSEDMVWQRWKSICYERFYFKLIWFLKADYSYSVLLYFYYYSIIVNPLYTCFIVTWT